MKWGNLKDEEMGFTPDPLGVIVGLIVVYGLIYAVTGNVVIVLAFFSLMCIGVFIRILTTN